MPRDRGRVSPNAHVWEAPKDALERDRGLRPGKLEPETEVHTRAEGEVRVRVARDVEPVRNVDLAGSQFAAARNAANMSPRRKWRPCSSPSQIAKRGFVICTGETWRRPCR